MNTYTVLRKIHLYAGLALLSFVVMYFVTGYPLIHYDWFPNPKAVQTARTETLAYRGPMEVGALSDYLQRTFDLGGKPTQKARARDASWRFRYVRPGTIHEVVVTPAADSVTIKTRQDNLLETTIGFHRLHGYGGGMLYNFWALLYDLASFSLIVFALTGIYLWYKLTKKRLLGWICLGLSYAYAAVTMLYLMYAP